MRGRAAASCFHPPAGFFVDDSSSLLGPVEFLVLWALKEIFSGGVLGLPADDRDPKIPQAAPASAVLYVEWAGRGAGREGGPGVDGLIADPEIRAFLSEIDRSLSENFGEDESIIDSEQPLLSRPGYEILKRVLSCPGGGYLRLDEDGLRKASESGPVDSWARVAAAGVEGALLLNAGDQADDLEVKLLALVNGMKEEGEEIEKLDHFVLPTTLDHWQLALHRHETHFILGVGRDATRRVVERLTAGKPKDAAGIDANPGYQALVKPLAGRRVASLAWIDVGKALATVREGLGDRGDSFGRVVEALGLSGLKSFSRTTTIVDGEVRTQARLTTDGRIIGLLALAAGRGLTAGDFNHVPADAGLVAGASVNVARLLDGVKDLAGRLDPAARAAIDEGLKQWEEEASISLDDVTAAFGDVWTLHAAPSQGSWLLSGAVLSLEVKDADRARTAVDKLQAVLSQFLGDDESGEGTPKFVEHDCLGRKVVVLSSSGPAGSFAPAFCLADRHLLFAANAQAIRTQLRQFAAGRLGTKSPFQAGEFPARGDLLALVRTDAKSWTTHLASVVPSWGRRVAEALEWQGIEFDPNLLPSIEGLLPYASPHHSRLVRDKDGIEWESRGGLPIPGGPALLLQLYHWLHANEFELEGDLGADARPGVKSALSLSRAAMRDGRVFPPGTTS